MDLSFDKINGNLSQEYPELEWGVCCVLITLDCNIRELFGKAGFNPFWVTDTTTKVDNEDGGSRPGSLHIKWMIIYYLDWAVHPRRWKNGDHPNVLGDQPDMRGPLSQLEVPPVSFRPRTDLQMDSMLDTVFYYMISLISVKYISA